MKKDLSLLALLVTTVVGARSDTTIKNNSVTASDS